MNIKQYNGKIIALVKPCIVIDENVGGFFKAFHQINRLMCGLFYVKVEQDQFTNTIHVELKPMYRYREYFNEFTKDFYYDGDNLLIVENTSQKFFYQTEINKAHEFADFINVCLDHKYKVESNPTKFYIKYYKSKIHFKNNSWYFNDSKITNEDLINYFFKFSWEYDEIQLKKYNVFKRFFSIFKKTNNILINKI